jgi:hypothetical protein
MPDTMIPPDAAAPASCGVMDRYRSPLIGKLVGARAKASGHIKAIIKDKKASIPTKTGGPGYQYRYADLADVMEAVEPALAEQGLAMFQTTVDRDRSTYLITTLAHESDQWIASEIRLKSADQGPQVFGSEMTYLRRYAALAIMALAPDVDDDGRAAQDRHGPAPRPQQPPDRDRESPLLTLKMPGNPPGSVSFPRTRAGLTQALQVMATTPGSVMLNLETLDAIATRVPEFADKVAAVRAAAAASLTPAEGGWPGDDAGAEPPQQAVEQPTA